MGLFVFTALTIALPAVLITLFIGIAISIVWFYFQDARKMHNLTRRLLPKDFTGLSGNMTVENRLWLLQDILDRQRWQRTSYGKGTFYIDFVKGDLKVKIYFSKNPLYVVASSKRFNNTGKLDINALELYLKDIFKATEELGD